MRKMGVFQHADRVDFDLKAFGGIARRVRGAFDAFHFPPITSREFEEVAHGAAYIQQFTQSHTIIEVVNDLSIESSDACVELAVFLDGREIGAFEIVVRFNPKGPRIHIDQPAFHALNNAEVPFLKDQARLVGAAYIAGDAFELGKSGFGGCRHGQAHHSTPGRRAKTLGHECTRIHTNKNGLGDGQTAQPGRPQTTMVYPTGWSRNIGPRIHTNKNGLGDGQTAQPTQRVPRTTKNDGLPYGYFRGMRTCGTIEQPRTNVTTRNSTRIPIQRDWSRG